MSKRKNLVEETEDHIELSPAPKETVGKMPTNISDGSKPLENCFHIPVNQLRPFGAKEGKDFSRLSPGLKPEFYDTIREDGILELLIVRPLKDQTGSARYEILSGETRWQAAADLNLQAVPCRVMNVDDARAHKIFSLTNLFRRDMKPSDKVRGYYHYYKYMIDNGQVKELQEGIQKKDAAVADNNVDVLSYRQLMYYVAMTDLTPEWLTRFDEDTVSIKAGSVISTFPPDIQNLMLPYVVTEQNARFLKDVYTGKNKDVTWHDGILAETLKPLKKGSAVKAEQPTATEETMDPVKAKQEQHFRKMRRNIINAVHTSLRPTDYDDAEKVIAEALRLYYQKMDKKKN